MPAKSLRLPNGHRTTSDRIQKVRVFPEYSESLCRIWVQVFEQTGLVYQGLMDLREVVFADNRQTEQPFELAGSDTPPWSGT